MTSWHQSGNSDLLRNPLPPPPSYDEDINILRDHIAKLIGKVTIPRAEQQAHPITKKLLANEEERIQYVARGWNWNPLRNVTPTGKRRLRRLNALLRTTQHLGCKPYVSTSMHEQDDSGGSVLISTQTVHFL